METKPPQEPEIQMPRDQITADLSGKKPIAPKELGFNTPDSKYATREFAKKIEGKDLVIVRKDGSRVIYTAERIAEEAENIEKNPARQKITKFLIMQSLVSSAMDGKIQELGSRGTTPSNPGRTR